MFKIFYAHNLLILTISYSVSPEQAFLVEQLKGAAQARLRPYPQTLV